MKICTQFSAKYVCIYEYVVYVVFIWTSKSIWICRKCSLSINLVYVRWIVKSINRINDINEQKKISLSNRSITNLPPPPLPPHTNKRPKSTPTYHLLIRMMCVCVSFCSSYESVNPCNLFSFHQFNLMSSINTKSGCFKIQIHFVFIQLFNGNWATLF